MDIRIGRNVINASTSDILSQISGYAFWIILALYTDPSTIGGIGLILSFVTILGLLIPLGIDFSMVKKVGYEIGNKNKSNASIVINSSTLLITLFLVFASVFILIFINPISEFSKISTIFLQYSIIIVISHIFHNFFRNAIIALQDKTSVIVYGEIFSHIAKFAVTFTLLYFDLGIFAIVLGFSSHYVLKIILWGKFIFKTIGPFRLSDIINPAISKIKLTSEGLLIWAPTLIGSLGTNLSILFVNTESNLANVGVYFIAMMIYITLSKVPSQVQSILFPVLSGYKTSINQILEKALIFSLLLIMPFTAMVMLYPEIFLRIFGHDFITGNDVVFLLCTVVFIDIISSTLMIPQLSKGKFGYYSLMIIPASLVRIALYFLLVPISGSLGAAQSWVIGSIIGFIIAMIILYKENIQLDWKKLTLLGLIPIMIGTFFKISDIHFSISFTLIFVISILLYIKLKILSRQDIEYVIKTVSPNDQSDILNQKISKLLDKLKL